MEQPRLGIKAAVRVSIIGFDGGKEKKKVLDGKVVEKINVDLTDDVNLSGVKQLRENLDISFQSIIGNGAFRIEESLAQKMLETHSNHSVVKRWVNAFDITHRNRKMWVIDFGINTTLERAKRYKLPFEYICQHVKPGRMKASEKRSRKNWWLFQRPRPAMQAAITHLSRYIATPFTSKYRLFVYLDKEVIPSSALIVIARDDDYFLGVLHSKPHNLWSLKQGTSLQDTPRYTTTTTFHTFPFPYPPNNEPLNNSHIKAISRIAHTLVRERDAWLNPSNLPEKELRKRTLTNLYNQRPLWLDKIHKKLDNVVFDAYGWNHNLSDNDILEKLLRLNLKRSYKDL